MIGSDHIDAESQNWKSLARFRHLYEVCESGLVRRVGAVQPRSMHPCSSGYLTCDLYVDGKRIHTMVHRLVAEAFIPNPLQLPVVNHKDGNKKNNSALNLEWVTLSENSLHSFHELGNKVPVLHGQMNRQHRSVVRISPNGDREFFSTMSEAATAGYDIRGIYAVCSGEQKTHRGMRWAYVTPAATSSHKRGGNVFQE